jgi:hypothetical protein
MVGVVNQRGIVGITPFDRAGQFYLPRENDFIVCALDSPIRTLAVNALGFLDFRAFEGQSGGCFQKWNPPILKRGCKK